MDPPAMKRRIGLHKSELDEATIVFEAILNLPVLRVWLGDFDRLGFGRQIYSLFSWLAPERPFIQRPKKTSQPLPICSVAMTNRRTCRILVWSISRKSLLF
jgi:hypothetical protein